MLRSLICGLAAAAALAASAPAFAATNLVTNGNFSQTTATTSRQMANDNGGTQFVTGWTSSPTNSSGTAGYNFIVKSATAATTQGGIQTNDNGTMSLWGNNGFKDSSSIGGSGGNFLAADGAYETSLIYQTISGLTVGQQYDLSFNWAGAQQYGYDGTTTDNWTVFWGTSTSNYISETTNTVTDANHGFTGWMTQDYTFTATSSTEILGFLATGTPNGEPPFALLDDVSLTQHVTPIAAVPEPASWAMMIGGFGLVGSSLRRRKKASALAA